jgi:hypothetical protein
MQHRWLRNHGGMLLPRCFLFALIVRLPLASGDLIEGAPLGLHLDV